MGPAGHDVRRDCRHRVRRDRDGGRASEHRRVGRRAARGGAPVPAASSVVLLGAGLTLVLLGFGEGRVGPAELAMLATGLGLLAVLAIRDAIATRCSISGSFASAATEHQVEGKLGTLEVRAELPGLPDADA